jgi:hypothetical protein
MTEAKDWRLTNQERYLKGVALRWRKYQPANPSNDHDHCEFCYSKFMVQNLPDVLHEGYATEDSYRWICKPCFEDFKELFQWQVRQPA